MLRVAFIFLLCSLVVACGDFPVWNAEEEAFEIVLVAGQSNTHRGLGQVSSLDRPEEGVFQLGRFHGYDYQIFKAFEPLHHHTYRHGRVGFALTFANLWVQTYPSDKKLLLIPCGYAGTGFATNHWNKGDPLFEDAVERVQFVLDANPESELKAVLWHQGEADRENPNFQKDLDQFIDDLRAELNAEQVPFLLGGMVPHWVELEENRKAVQKILEQTPQRKEGVGYVDPMIPFVIEKPMNSKDEVHFDAEGQRELGRRYFGVYEQMVSEGV